MDWYKNFAKDFLEGTDHMTNEEVGIYKRLLDHQWCRGGRLYLDRGRLAMLVRCTTRRFEKLWAAAIGEKFDQDEDGYFNRRLERERLNAVEIASKRSHAARVRWDSKSNASASGVDKQTRCTRDLTSLLSVSTSEKDALPAILRTEEFATVWAKWITYRRTERRPAVTEEGARRQLTKLAKYGPAVAIMALEDSMSQGYQGIFPEKFTEKKRPVNDTGPIHLVDSSFYRCRHCPYGGSKRDVASHMKTTHQDSAA